MADPEFCRCFLDVQVTDITTCDVDEVVSFECRWDPPPDLIVSEDGTVIGEVT